LYSNEKWIEMNPFFSLTEIGEDKLTISIGTIFPLNC
jgi:hypothetical protein